MTPAQDQAPCLIGGDGIPLQIERKARHLFEYIEGIDEVDRTPVSYFISFTLLAYEM
jgi:hypothetical protein